MILTPSKYIPLKLNCKSTFLICSRVVSISSTSNQSFLSKLSLEFNLKSFGLYMKRSAYTKRYTPQSVLFSWLGTLGMKQGSIFLSITS